MSNDIGKVSLTNVLYYMWLMGYILKYVFNEVFMNLMKQGTCSFSNLTEVK